MLWELISTAPSTAVLGAALLLLLAIYTFYDGKSRKLPPGPTGLPFVGYLPFLIGNPHIKLTELSKIYGPVYSMRIGSRLVVLLCDYPSIKKYFALDALMGRPPDSPFELSEENVKSGAVNGLPWKEQRRFSLQLLKDLGLGRSLMETHITEEIEELLQRLENENGKPIMPSVFTSPSTSNNISSLVFGKRRKFDDPKRIMLDKTLQKTALLVGRVAWLTFFPSLKSFFRFFNIGKQDELSRTIFEMKEYIREEIADHKKTLDKNHIRDYIDGYLLEIERTKNDPKSTFITPVLQDMVGMFFGAGSETIRTAVDWLLLASAALPDVQRRVQSEIDEVVGRERMPVRADHLKMPYTEAAILEVLRWRAGIQVNLPRYTLEEVQLDSYIIPKHTHVVSVFWALNHDPKLWGDDVNEFKPSRFLSEDGKSAQKPEYYIPFSIGKRACPGETLAYMEVFMYYAAILQRFNLRLPEGEKADFDARLGLALQPKPYKLHFELRK